ncbi:hypothetical protein E2C01_063550 [Portunus trituberculatus]|uniref:Reverse transcriptase domain-containing protein n=1 Tax=Portunus trituberculatus TaxID=210409 RepID=A0A5B7HKS5_PORTR|nr:hypothetical protein [Portunus trituberculatus]
MADSVLALLAKVCIVVFLNLEKAFKLASPHTILTALVLRSSLHELENGTPQGDILIPFFFNLLMEQLVTLPFHDSTVLLSYADYLVLVDTVQISRLCSWSLEGATSTGGRSRHSTSSMESARSWDSRSRPRSPGP